MRLSDALRVCLIIRDHDPEQFQRAQMRWLMRFAQEARDLSVADVERAAQALGLLPIDPDSAMEELSSVCREHRLPGF
jgi:hypothetical protein